MKCASILALGVVASAAGNAPRGLGSAAHAEPPRNAITIEPLPVVFARTIAVEYERGIGSVGLHLGGAVTLGDFDASDGAGDYLAAGATLGVRFYPWSDAPQGAFIGPFGSFAWVRATRGADRAEALGWSAGAMVGWTWVLGGLFALSLGAGAAWYAFDVDVDAGGSAAPVGREGFLPALRLGVGAAF